MSLKNQRGIVRYQGRDDIVCAYGIRDDGVQFYYLDADGKPLKNGYHIATTALVEAVDPMVKASNIGIIDGDGKEIIPFTNRSIRSVNDDIILVEPATPTTQSVIEALQLKSDPLSATKLVSTPALIKEKLNAKVGSEGRYLFNDQFSEATVCDINGNNLVDGASYSFIVSDGKTLFFSKNTADSEITSYSILPPEVQSDVTDSNNLQTIDVNNVSVSQDIVENALNTPETVEQATNEGDNVSKEAGAEMSHPVTEAVQNNPIEENKVSVEESTVDTSENSQDNVQDTNMETGFEIPKVDIDVPNLPSEIVAPGVEEDQEEDKADENEEVSEDDVKDNKEEQTEDVEEVKNESIENDVNTSSLAETGEDSVEKEQIVDNEEEDKDVQESVDSELEEDDEDELDAVEIEVKDDEKNIDEEIDSESEEDVSFDSNLVDNEDDFDDDLLKNTYDIDEVDLDDDFGDIQIDHIDDSAIDDFDSRKYHDHGDVVPDAIDTINDLVNKYQITAAELSDERAKNAKLSAFSDNLKEQNRVLRDGREKANKRNELLEREKNRLNAKVDAYAKRLRVLEKTIKSQNEELSRLRPIEQKTAKLFSAVASAQELLNDR